MPDSAMAVTSTAPDRVAPEAAPERTFATPVERLSTLLQRADAASGEARRTATQELNALLGQMSRFASRPVADLLLRWLDQGALSDLEDGDGLTARAAATAAVLSMGYPYALEISPDDLDHLRERSAVTNGLGGALAAFLVVAVTSGFAVLEMVTRGAWLGHLQQLASLALVIASMTAVTLSRARGSGRRWALISLLLSGLLAGSFAMSSPSLLLPAIGAIVAFAIAWPRRGS